MTALRLISLPVHGAVEMLIGVLLMTGPFVLGLSTAGAVIAVTLGAVVTGLALAISSTDERNRSMAISTHHELDFAVGLGLLGSAAVLAAAGDDRIGAVFLALMAIAQLSLTLTTRYSRRA